MTQTTIPLTETAAIEPLVRKVVGQQPVTDMHTHCFAPAFGACPEPKGISSKMRSVPRLWAWTNSKHSMKKPERMPG